MFGAAQVVNIGVFLLTIVILLSIVRKILVQKMVVKDVVGQSIYKSRGSDRTRMILGNHSTGNALFRLKPKELTISQVVSTKMTKEGSSEGWKPPLRSIVSGKIVTPKILGDSSKALPFSVYNKRQRPSRAAKLTTSPPKYSKSSCVSSDFVALRCEGTKPAFGSGTRRMIGVLPQARQRNSKEFRFAADDQQYKLASPNIPVPPIRLPTRIMDASSTDMPCSFQKFNIPLPEHDPPHPYVFRVETRKPFCMGVATNRKPKDGNISVSTVLSSSSSMSSIQRENSLAIEESLKKLPYDAGCYNLGSDHSSTKDTDSSGDAPICEPRFLQLKDVGTTITDYDRNHTDRIKVERRVKSAHPRKALHSVPTIAADSVLKVNDELESLKLTKEMTLRRGTFLSKMNILSDGKSFVKRNDNCKTRQPMSSSECGQTSVLNPPLSNIGITHSSKMNNAIPAASNRHKSGPSLNTVEYAARAVSSMSSRISISLPTKTFSGLDIKEKQNVVSKGIPVSTGHYNLNKKRAETKCVRKFSQLDTADVSSNIPCSSPKMPESIFPLKTTDSGNDIEQNEKKWNNPGHQALLTAQRTGFDKSKKMGSSGTSYVPISGRISNAQRSDRAVFPLNIVSGICRGATGELEADSGLPVIGCGNHWKQFPPPAASNRRQRLSRLSFMKKNESDYEVETSARGGAAASIPLYNSTPADLVVEGNTSIRIGNQSKKTGRWWRGNDSIIDQNLRPCSKTNASQHYPSPATPDHMEFDPMAKSAKMHGLLERDQSTSTCLPLLFSNRKINPNSKVEKGKTVQQIDFTKAKLNSHQYGTNTYYG